MYTSLNFRHLKKHCEFLCLSVKYCNKESLMLSKSHITPKNDGVVQVPCDALEIDHAGHGGVVPLCPVVERNPRPLREGQ